MFNASLTETNPYKARAQSWLQQFYKALKKVEKEKGYSILEHMIRRAYVNDTVGNTIFNRLVPEKTVNELSFGGLGRFVIMVDNRNDLSMQQPNNAIQ